MKGEVKERIVYLEKLRVITMFLVVYAHCCGVALSQYRESALQSWKAVVLFTLRNMCFSSVPIFFMISGSLFLNPKYELRLDRFLKKHVLKYVSVAVIFGWAYALMDMVFSNRTGGFSLSMIWDSFLNMLQGETATHMWYMYELVGVMLFLPAVKAIVNGCEKRTQYYLGLVFFIFMICIPMLNKVLDSEIAFQIPLSSVYVLYMLIGHWLSEAVLKKKKAVIVISVLVILASFGSSIYDAYRTIFQDLDPIWNKGYSPVVFFRAIAIFLLFRLCFDKKNKVYSVCKFLSPYSFGVYLIHVLWIQIIVRFVHINPFEGIFVLKILLLWGAALVLSVLSCMIMKKIPLVKKLV